MIVALIVSSILISKSPKLLLNEIFCGFSFLTDSLNLLSKEIALLIPIVGAAFLVCRRGPAWVLKNRNGLTKFLAFAIIVVLVLYTTSSQYDFPSNNVHIKDESRALFAEAQNSVEEYGEEIVASDDCIDCHTRSQVLDVISLDWENSKHAEAGTTCIDCHQADTSDPDSYSHNGFEISHVVSPQDCAKCHSNQAEEFKQSLHSLGAVYYEYLFDTEKLPYIESQMEGGFIVSEGQEIPRGYEAQGQERAQQAAPGSSRHVRAHASFVREPIHAE